MSFEVSILGAFLAGLLSFLSPCVLPLVPPYLCFLAGVSLGELAPEGGDGRSNRVVQHAAMFVFGFSTVFVALGASASFVGKALTEYFGVLSMVAGFALLVLGLHFLGLFRIALLLRDVRFQTSRSPAGLFGAYIVGLIFAFGWTPCVGPVLAAILLVAGAEDTARRGATLLAAYSIGIGAPFMLAALFAGPFMRAMSRMRRYIPMVEKTVGGALVITGALFLTGAMPRIAGWLLTNFPAFAAIG
jgi:cytochrome c-type biogenesis protein